MDSNHEPRETKRPGRPGDLRGRDDMGRKAGPTSPEQRLRSAVERAKRSGRRVAISVGGAPGLQARVSPTGAVSYLLRYRAAGVQRALAFRSADLGRAHEHARDLLA